MATGEQHIGRREAIGLGIEATPGTAVAPQIWLRWLDNGFQNKTNVVENDSAMGVVDEINDSEVTARWAEGTVGGKVTSVGIGFLLSGFFGLPTTSAADENDIYPHAFKMSQSSIPQTLTLSRNNPIEAVKHSYAVVDTLEISAETNDYVKVSAAIKSRVSASATLTPAFEAEAEFTSKNIVTKLAANIGSLSGATALKTSSVKLNLERPSEPFNPLGTSDEPEFDRLQFTVSGEVVIRYTDTQYETDFLSNAAKAMSVTMTNGNESLAFTLSQVRYRELEKSTDKNGVVTQTLSIKGEYNATEGNSITALLKNGRATYEADS